jgi:hypothetical protein
MPAPIPPIGGDGIMGAPPVPPPTPPPHPHPTPYPYPYYPGPVYYNPFPRTYIIEDAPVRPRLSNRDYLIKSIAKLEMAYDDAVANLMLGRALNISRKIKALERELDRYRN